MGYAPLALQAGSLLAGCPQNRYRGDEHCEQLSLCRLMPETEYLAEQGLVGLARTAFKPCCAVRGKAGLFRHKPAFLCLS